MKEEAFGGSGSVLPAQVLDEVPEVERTKHHAIWNLENLVLILASCLQESLFVI